MAEVNRKNKQNKGAVPSNGLPVSQDTHDQSVVHNSDTGNGDVPAIPLRASIDDSTWEKAVMEVMEEYDEAWTKLADA